MKVFNIFKPNKIYLDHAGATPVHKDVVRKMQPYLMEHYANPSAIHSSGVFVRSALEKARKKIAKEIFAHSDEIIFTSSATESNAMAILGIVKASKIKPHIITSNIEHSAVLENFKMLEGANLAEVTYVPVESNGIIDVKKIKESIKENTILISVMYANNEIGTIQPIQEIAKMIRLVKKNGKDNIFFHTDACQAMNYLDTSNIDRLGVDLMSFNGSKIYGPKGVGILYKKRGVELGPIYTGGGQEFGLRSGTENVAGAIGIAKALKITNKIKEKEIQRLAKLQEYFIKELENLSTRTNYKILINGDITNRLPNNINISISDISSELVVIELDAKGIEVSSKSACSEKEEGNSHVIEAIRTNDNIDFTKESIRFSMGRSTNKSQITRTISVLESILQKYSKWK